MNIDEILDTLEAQPFCRAQLTRALIIRAFAAGRADASACPFRFTIGQRVRWAVEPDQVWEITLRRYTEGYASPTVEYGLLVEGQPAAARSLLQRMAYEPDVTAIAEDTP